MPVVQATKVNYIVRQKTILEDISFDIEKGEYVGLIGPNGAGKTTLLKLILQIKKPTQGSIQTILKSKIGYVPQNQNQINHFPISTKEVLHTGLLKSHFWLSKKQISAIHETLSKVSLPKDILHKNFQELSDGQKQRVLIARSLIKKPELILFDEPFNGVDQRTQVEIYKLLENLNRKGTTILFVSHDIQTITQKCQRVLCLNKKLQQGCYPIQKQFKDRKIPIYHNHN